MHMSDALISPAVGGAMLAVSVGCVGHSARRLRAAMDDSRAPAMGVMGAFVFAAQMVNFAIPGTGSSGHIAGGLLLAVVLGPHASMLAIAAVLFIQALVFADGGLLAYGCNVFNIGFLACWVAYPLAYRTATRRGLNARSIWLGCMSGAIVALQLGAFAVVLETLLSGKTELPFAQFALFMQPVHLLIGIAEGAATAAVVAFVWKTEPALLYAGGGDNGGGSQTDPSRPARARRVLVCIGGAAALAACVLALFASQAPDGLEWSVSRAARGGDVSASSSAHNAAGAIQGFTSLFPGYAAKDPDGAFDVPPANPANSETADSNPADSEIADTNPADSEPSQLRAGATTSMSGLIGAALTLCAIGGAGFALSRSRRRVKNAENAEAVGADCGTDCGAGGAFTAMAGPPGEGDAFG